MSEIPQNTSGGGASPGRRSGSTSISTKPVPRSSRSLVTMIVCECPVYVMQPRSGGEDRRECACAERRKQEVSPARIARSELRAAIFFAEAGDSVRNGAHHASLVYTSPRGEVGGDARLHVAPQAQVEDLVLDGMVVLGPSAWSSSLLIKLRGGLPISETTSVPP